MERGRKATYLRIVSKIRPEKKEKHLVWFTCGGDRVDYPGKVSTRTCGMVTAMSFQQHPHADAKKGSNVPEEDDQNRPRGGLPPLDLPQLVLPIVLRLTCCHPVDGRYHRHVSKTSLSNSSFLGHDGGDHFA